MFSSGFRYSRFNYDRSRSLRFNQESHEERRRWFPVITHSNNHGAGVMHIPDIHSKNKCSVQGKSPSKAHSSERIVTRLGPVTHICDNNNSKDHDGWLATVKCVTGGSVNALSAAWRRTYGPVMGCIPLVIQRKMTAIYRKRIVFWCRLDWPHFTHIPSSFTDTGAII